MFPFWLSQALSFFFSLRNFSLFRSDISEVAKMKATSIFKTGWLLLTKHPWLEVVTDTEKPLLQPCREQPWGWAVIFILDMLGWLVVIEYNKIIELLMCLGTVLRVIANGGGGGGDIFVY